MKPDLYTKVVLTVIAVCLVVLAGKELQIIPNAQASGSGVVQVDISYINGHLIRGSALPVDR